jgi:hypothetical protein
MAKARSAIEGRGDPAGPELLDREPVPHELAKRVAKAYQAIGFKRAGTDADPISV